MSALLRSCVAAFSACITVHAAFAQALGDPTRPPRVAATPGTPAVESEAPRQLQSVLISPNRKVAVIDGQMVALGEQVGDAVVAKIAETEVVLKYPDRTETLKLLGDVERRPVGRAHAKNAK